MTIGKRNAYTCGSCRSFIITLDRDEGATPFLIPCVVQRNCSGIMQSALYRGLLVNGEEEVTHEWRKATTVDYRAANTGLKAHYDQGGLALHSVEFDKNLSPDREVRIMEREKHNLLLCLARRICRDLHHAENNIMPDARKLFTERRKEYEALLGDTSKYHSDMSAEISRKNGEIISLKSQIATLTEDLDRVSSWADHWRDDVLGTARKARRDVAYAIKSAQDAHDAKREAEEKIKSLNDYICGHSVSVHQGCRYEPRFRSYENKHAPIEQWCSVHGWECPNA